jgi:PKD repeat protein
VKLRSDLTPAQRTVLWSELPATSVEPFKGLHDVYVLQFPDDEDEVLVAERLAADGRALWAQPNFRRSWLPLQAAPADPYYPLQWHLNNTGQFGGPGGADIDAPEAWEIATGQGIIVGMLDDACDVDHEDLRDNYIGTGHDAKLTPIFVGYTDPRPEKPGDDHGTAVMGLMAASANDRGVRGVAYGATFTASRGLLDASDAGIASAYTFAVEKKVDVHNNSWGPTRPDIPTAQVIVDAIQTAFHDGRDPDGDGPLPPRGMVIVFATGNDGRELVPAADYAALPEVIAVGASSIDDKVSDFSNFGSEIEFLAPSGDDFRANIATTDVTDTAGYPTLGYNVGGLPGGFNFPDLGSDIDPDGLYTKFFGGTSAASPIAAGVAALILSVNPDLTATDVRLVMEHTCEQIDAANAQYDTVTGKSVKYGHGRINAHRAVVAASESLTNGGLAWPDVPVDLQVDGSTLLWKTTSGASEFLVLEINNVFDNVIQDDACYDSHQGGCANATLVVLPADVIPHFVACATDCVAGSEQSFDFVLPIKGTKRLGVYARNSIGHYSFGAKAEVSATEPPAVTISVSPLEGNSPLTVYFSGNAVSDVALDESRTVWDFDVDDNSDLPDATTRTANNALDPYVVAPGDNRIYFARLTMYNVQGLSGSAEVGILVHGPKLDDTNGTVSDGDVRIIVGLPGSPGSDDAEGTSPFSVLLTIDAPGLFETVESVVVEWDLGDGTRETALSVQHTYENNTDFDVRIPIVATVTTTSGGTTTRTTATRFITVQPGIPVIDPGVPNLPGTHPGGAGGAATPCSGVGMIPLLLTLTSLLWMRRRY